MRQIQSENPLVPTHAIGIIKPLVSVMALAILSMGATQVHATPPTTACQGATVSETSTATVSATCTIISGGAIDVVGGSAINVFTNVEAATATIINNAGRISGVTGIDIQDNYSTTTITNSGILAGTSFAVNRNYTFQNVSINNNSGGQLVGGIVATSLINNGTVTLKSAVDLNDSANSGNTATALLSGGFVGGAGSTLRITIVDTSVEMDYSYLQAASATVDGTLDVDVKTTSGLSAGQAFHVVRATGMTTTFDEVTDNSAMFNFTQRLEGTGIYIDSVRALSAFQTSGKNAGLVLDSDVPGLNSVVTALGMLATEQEVADAVESTQPDISGGVAQLTNTATNAMTGVVSDRQNAQQGISSGDAFMTDRHVWLKPFGSWAEQDNRRGVTGYEIDSYGLALGVDGDVSSSWNVGAAFAYINSDVESNLAAGSHQIDMDSYLAKIYATKIFDDVTALNLQAGVGISDYDSRRRIFTGDVANADYDSWNTQLSAELERSFQVSDKTVMTPYIHTNL